MIDEKVSLPSRESVKDNINVITEILSDNGNGHWETAVNVLRKIAEAYLSGKLVEKTEWEKTKEEIDADLLSKMVDNLRPNRATKEEILEIICKTLYPDYALEPSIRKQFEPLAEKLVGHIGKREDKHYERYPERNVL